MPDLLTVLPHVPTEKRRLLVTLVDRLRTLPGMAAVVLGGSYASGAQHAASDLDIGLYYWEAAPFALDAVRQIADSVSNQGSATVTDFYEWGAWVNGGAWIHTAQGKVDFLYRNLDQVQRTLREAAQGITQHDYDQQPTHGFYSVIYLAETQICVPLYDPKGLIAELKQQVAVYPPKLKQQLVSGALWAAEFSLLFARDFAAKGDIYNTVGCLTRVTANLTQALFALNERYFMRDKQVMTMLASFSLLPPTYCTQIEQLLACPGSTAAALAQTVQELTQSWQSVVALAGDLYQPKFQL
ncbi:MAG: nucleotidyltransferase domain-containing protein [Caldilineaceae bacterium]